MKPAAKDRKPTWTSKVEEVLRLADDFLAAKEIQAKLEARRNQIFAALWHLRDCKVIDSVESGGKLYWFYKGHEEDPRCRIIEERCPEDKPRKTRRVRVQPGGHVFPAAESGEEVSLAKPRKPRKPRDTPEEKEAMIAAFDRMMDSL